MMMMMMMMMMMNRNVKNTILWGAQVLKNIVYWRYASFFNDCHFELLVLCTKPMKKLQILLMKRYLATSTI